MTGILSQFITLVGYGNDYLKNGELPGGFYPAHSSFDFCREVSFIDGTKGIPVSEDKKILIASDPVEWLQGLKREKCNDLKLFFNYSGNNEFPDYQSAGMVGGGGYWRIEANYDNGTSVWASRWEPTDLNSPDKKIWTVNYGLLHAGVDPTEMPCDLEVIKNVTEERLIFIIHFCEKLKLNNWKKTFESAFSTLHKNDPLDDDYLRVLIPQKNYSLIAKQLLGSACQMHVFGGMGSWNDMSFSNNEIQEEYEKLSYDVYDNICVNILAAINSF